MEATDRSILLSKTVSVDSDSFFISIKAGDCKYSKEAMVFGL